MKTFNTVSQLRLSRRNDRHKDTVFFALNCLFPHLERFKIKFISPLCFTISKVDQTEFESLLLSLPSQQEIEFLWFSHQVIELSSSFNDDWYRHKGKNEKTG